MNKKELIKAMNERFRVVFITTICCSTFWIISGITFYRYIINERTTPSDRQAQMASGFYKREVKIKIDSITNALIIQTLRSQLVEKQVMIDSLEKAYMSEIQDSAEKLNRLHRNEYESDELMMFMNLKKNLRNEYEVDPGILVLSSKDYMTKCRVPEATSVRR